MTVLPEPTAMSVHEAVTGRRSVRRFLPTPVPAATLDAILEAASRAPSGTNIQPWHVHVVLGEARERMSRAVCAAAEAGERSLEYRYLPEVMRDPYLSRRRKVGYELYGLYQIDRQDYAARQRAMLRNFDFFGAPVGLFFTMEREMELGSWLDIGMFMQSVMLLARAYGLESCAQQAWCDYGETVRRELGVSDKYILLSGMALGHEDPSAPENGLVTDRVPVGEFATVHC